MLVVRSKRWVERQAFALVRADQYSRSIARFATDARQVIEGLVTRMPQLTYGVESVLAEFRSLDEACTPATIKQVARDSHRDSMSTVKRELGRMLAEPLHKFLDEVQSRVVRAEFEKREAKRLQSEIRDARNKIVQLAYEQIGADVSRDGEYSPQFIDRMKVAGVLALIGAGVWFYLEKLA